MRKKKHSQIIELLENKNVMSIRELAQALDCTEMTIRRNGKVVARAKLRKDEIKSLNINAL